jgi:chromosome segregation ATPase
VILNKNLPGQDSLNIKLNFLFSLFDPQLSYTRANGLNSLILEKETLTSAIRFLSAQAEQREAFTEIITGQIDALNEQVHERDQVLKALQAQLRERQDLVLSLQAHLAERNAHIQSLTAQFKMEVERYQAELEQWKTEAVNYALSTSWRITRPFRIIGRAIKGKSSGG